MTAEVEERESMVDYDEQSTKKDELESKYLSFPLADSLYGIDIQHVKEVVIFSENMKITQVPHMPGFTKGVINLRGKVIPIIDLRLRFLLDEVEYGGRTCFVVVKIEGVTTGLVVDTVAGVVTFKASDIDPAPELNDSAQSKFIYGIGKTKDEVYILLDTEKLLHQKELEALKKA
ncbi:MAG: chemotaxis protein CheW [Proteobacteria bacterium]|nr:chemotaxis protein CheW [Pseudomonadota bacterium]